jgi:two-component system chemotaxis response regulator CheY
MLPGLGNLPVDFTRIDLRFGQTSSHCDGWTEQMRGIGSQALPDNDSREKQMNVLIVDDSAAIRKILQRVLGQANVPITQVFEASDGLEALAVLRSNRVGLILSDINMPNMDGLQFLSEVRSMDEWKSVPIVMITTEGSHAKVMEAVQLGASGYVRKPFTPDQIKEKLAGLI